MPALGDVQAVKEVLEEPAGAHEGDRRSQVAKALLQQRQGGDHSQPAGPVRPHRRERDHARRRGLGQCLDIVRDDALGLEIRRGGPDGRQHDECAVDAVERPLDGGRIVPVAIDQFDTVVRPACGLSSVADQRADLLAVVQQRSRRCAADSEQWSELRRYLIDFVAELGNVRPNEIALLSVQRRQEVRMRSVADQGIFWISYLRLAAWLREHAPTNWRAGLAALGETYRHEVTDSDAGNTRTIYTGDLMSRENPLWRARGIVAATDKPGVYRVISNRHAQEQAFLILRGLVQRKINSLPTAAAA